MGEVLADRGVFGSDGQEKEIGPQGVHMRTQAIVLLCSSHFKSPSLNLKPPTHVDRMVFQARPFWVYATPLFHRYFPHTAECSVTDFYQVQRVTGVRGYGIQRLSR